MTAGIAAFIDANAIACRWRRTEEDYDIFEAGCTNGRTFEFNDGDPAANYFAYCPYCGRPLVLARDDEVDDAVTP